MFALKSSNLFGVPTAFQPFGPIWAPQVLGEDGLREVRVIGFKGISENEEVTVTRWWMDADGHGTKVYKSSLKHLRWQEWDQNLKPRKNGDLT